MNDYYQTCTLVLSDGQRLTWTGRVQVEDVRSAKVVEVIISEPQRFPVGIAWAPTNEEGLPL